MKTTQKENGVLVPDKRLPDVENTPTRLIELAISQNADVDKLEKLMELQMRWSANEARKKFFEALTEFQFEMPVVSKNKKVDFTSKQGFKVKYEYATLDQIIKEAKPVLHKHGLSYRWEFSEDNIKIICTCILTHSSGHSETTTMSAVADATGVKNDIQSRGSSMTYMQRYTLIGALGLSTAQDDTDAVAVEPSQPKQDKRIIKEPVPTNTYDKSAIQKQIDDFKDYDMLRNWANGHDLKNNPGFQQAVFKRLDEIKNPPVHTAGKIEPNPLTEKGAAA